MCLFRDWAVCWALSIGFELLELSMGWLVPQVLMCSPRRSVQGGGTVFCLLPICPSVPMARWECDACFFRELQ